jgi:hypothetical protein
MPLLLAQTESSTEKKSSSMNFPRLLRTLFRIIFSKFERVPDRVDPAEDISRFIFSKDHFNIEKRTVKVAAFMPKEGGVICVYRTTACTEEKIWWPGEWCVARDRKDGRSILARGDLKGSDFLEQALEVRKHPRPHPRHADIIGWPNDKPTRKMKATALANLAEPHLKPHQ